MKEVKRELGGGRKERKGWWDKKCKKKRMIRKRLREWRIKVEEGGEIK